MSFYYTTNPNHACSSSHAWHLSYVRPGLWYVGGFGQWMKSGYAVVDDFGDLVIVQESM